MADRIRKVNSSARDIRLISLSDLAAAYCHGIDVANDGTVYVADHDRKVVYKIFEDGRVNGALIGKINTAGDVLADGIVKSGLDARISEGMGICVDASNNIYLSEVTYHKIKKITPSGRVRDLAGTGVSGDTVNDNGLLCRFNSPWGLAVDKAGIVYVADRSNHKIKKIFTSGKTTSLAGGTGGGFANGTGADALFSTPYDVAVDNHGNLYVADTGNNRIRKVTESGVVTTLAGTGVAGTTDGIGTVATFNAPAKLCIDPSNQFLYVMDGPSSKRIRKVMMDGTTTTFTTYKVGTGTHGDITVDKSGFLYILEGTTN